jgi:hypothetical protein
MLTTFKWYRTGMEAGSCENFNEPFGDIKGGEFIDYLSEC